jgi:uncharacterized phage protein (TIGR02218 family)
MRQIPQALMTALQSGATTLCRCWKATRRDGAILGFTDHDRDLVFGGVTFAAATGLDAAEAESMLGLAIGGGEVSGALTAVGIREQDVRDGLWDGAQIETWLVDWSDAARRMLLDAGEIGDIRQEGEAFSAEVRSLAHQLDQTAGRRYASRCDAVLGDGRCGVDLAQIAHRAARAIASVSDASRFAVPALTAFSVGAFIGGTVRFEGGANVGLTMPIMGHARAGTLDEITLWQAPPRPLAAADPVTLTVGCDRAFATCRDRFANAVNFRGFPHIPGNDHLMAYARQGEADQDGGVVAR